MKRSSRLFAAAFVLASVLAACGGSPSGDDQVRVVLDPPEVTLQAGGEQSFTATVMGARDPSVTWTTTGGAITGSGGTVVYTSPLSEGTYEVAATSVDDPSASATAVVTVEGVGGARIEIVSEASILLTGAGDSAQVDVVVFESDGSIDGDAVVAWASDGPDQVSIDGEGVVTARVDAGYTTVRASYGDIVSEPVTIAIAQPKAETRLVPSDRVLAIAPDGTSATLVRDAESEGLAAGDIVVSNAGLLSRVVAVDVRSDRVGLDLVGVDLADAFERVIVDGISDPIEYEAVFRDATVTVRSDDVRVPTRSFAFDDLECESTVGLDVGVRLTGASFRVRNAPRARFSYDSASGDVEIAYVGRSSIEGTLGSIEMTAGGDVGVSCGVVVGTASVPIASFWGVVSITGDIDVTAGFEMRAGYEAAMLEVTGPSFDVALVVEAGIRYEKTTNDWSTFGSADSEIEDTWGSIDSDITHALDLYVGPYLSTTIGLSGRVAAFSIAGIDALEPKFSTGLAASVPAGNPYARSYAGSAVSRETRVGVGVALEPSGGLERLLKRFKVENLSWTLADFTLVEASDDLSPEPLLEASASSVAENVRLTASVSNLRLSAALLAAGREVEFLSFRAGASVGAVIGSASVDPVTGTASITWRPTSDDNGDVRIAALLYARGFGSLNRPFRSSNTVDLVVDVVAPPDPVPVPGPDLIIEGLVVDPTPSLAGDPVTIRFTVRNQGDGVAAASTAFLGVNRSTSGPPTQWQGERFVTPSLAAGAGHEVVSSEPIPAGFWSGSYVVWAVADIDSTAGQSDESNDVARVDLVVEGRANPCAFQDVEVDIVDAELEGAIREELSQPTGPITCWGMFGLGMLGPFENTDIASLEGLQYAGSLNTLWIRSGGRGLDLSPLADLPMLYFLEVAASGVDDLAPLANLDSLRQLTLDLSDTGDLTPLSGLQLTDFSMNESGIADLRPLAGMRSLEFLQLMGNQISDLTPLEGLTSLTDLLNLGGNQIHDVAPLAGMTDLTRLWLSGNQISDISPLANLANLTEFDLSANQIVDLAPVAGMADLARLSLDNNLINDLGPLVDNVGLGVGDDVRLTGNCLDLRTGSSDMSAIDTLIARGAEVRYYPQAACGNNGDDPGPGPVPAGELITNGDFGSGDVGWLIGPDFWIGEGERYRSPTNYAAGGVDGNGFPISNAQGLMQQTVAIPSGVAEARFSFWYYISSDDSRPGRDHLNVLVAGSSCEILAASFDNLDSTDGVYRQHVVDVSACIGETVDVSFVATTDDLLDTVFRIDDVSLMGYE